MSEIRVSLCDCEAMLLREIADKRMFRKDVAMTYALARQSSEAPTVNWTKVHEAIIARWSPAALAWIKEQAYTGKCFTARPPGSASEGAAS